METVDLPCSRNARPQKALVERAQWEVNQPPSLRDNERAWKDQLDGWGYFDARSKEQSAYSLWEVENQKAFARARARFGTFRVGRSRSWRPIGPPF